MQYLKKKVLQLFKKGQANLQRYFSVHGRLRLDLRKITTRDGMKKSGVEKNRHQAIAELVAESCRMKIAAGQTGDDMSHIGKPDCCCILQIGWKNNRGAII